MVQAAEERRRELASEREGDGFLAGIAGGSLTQTLVRAGRLLDTVRDGIVGRITTRRTSLREVVQRRGSNLEILSAIASDVFLLPEATVSENIARIRGTGVRGAHIFLVGGGKSRLGPVKARLKAFIIEEVEFACELGARECELAISEVRDVALRNQLRRRFRRIL